MNNCFIYVGTSGVFFKKGEKYYLVSTFGGTGEICIKDRKGTAYYTTSYYLNDSFKKLETIREEKIKVILDEN